MKRINKPVSIFKIFGITGFLLLSFLQLIAKEDIGNKPGPRGDEHTKQLMLKGSGCAAATAQREMSVNNVRTRILNGGDMWWDLSSAKYEIPKVQPGQVSKNSLFAGALWIGGVTNGNIRVAAQTYRQNGNDYYPGPLSIGSASILATRCLDFDKIWSVQFVDIDAFRSDPTQWSNPSDDIATWPWQGDPSQGEAKYLAPFYDANGNGIYEYNKGEYPTFDQNQKNNIPDQMMFILYNDKGNIHSETQGVPIGLEFQTQAFAYSTNDEINNMTFYRTRITNRSTEKIDSCVFGQWVDPDLGNYADDYVECDVTRNLGICYNGEDNDPGPLGYGLNPPSIGVNFFQGPKRADGSEIGLTKFVYYNNDWSLQGNPQQPGHYWGYLNGRWKDGSPITYGGNGKIGSDTASFMFPGSTDPAGRAPWTEVTAGNTPGDRRFLQTAGPFTLLPGAVNNVTIGVVWARASSGGARGSFRLLQQASDKAFALFKNNFNLIQGPKAPTLQITELDKKLLFTITNTETIENFSDSFVVISTVGSAPCGTRTVYKFQGYQVFQLKLPNIPNDFSDPTQAVLVAQFDIIDNISKRINFVQDPDLGEIGKLMVSGNNTGIQHSFEIDKDFFQTGTDQTLVNFQNYHYVIVAYASSVNCNAPVTQYLPSSKTIGQSSLVVYTSTPHDPAPRGNGTQISSSFGDGIPITQLEGIGNGGNIIQLSQESIKEAMTPSPDPDLNYRSKIRKYILGASPVYVKVINPLAVVADNYELWMTDESTSSHQDTVTANQTTWSVRNSKGEVVKSVQSIATPYEQIIPQWGLSINIAQCIQPGNASSETDQSNGFIQSSITYANPKDGHWLGGVIDDDPNYLPYIPNQINWIRAGTTGKDIATPYAYALNDKYLNSDFGYPGTHVALDPRKNFSKIINSTWAPYALANRFNMTVPPAGQLSSFGPGSDINGSEATTDNPLSDLHSIQVFFTSDKSKWSRCLVLESGEDANLNVGGAYKLDIRVAQSVDKDGHPAAAGSGASANAEDANYISETGMGWFPGYAIDLETGDRLNILFAEDSSLPTENGADMIWNPTANIVTYKTNQLRPLFGGKHFIYVMGVKKFALGATKYTPSKYDACQNYNRLLGDKLNPNNGGGTLSGSLAYKPRKRIFFSQALYTSIPTLAIDPATHGTFSLKSVDEGLIPNDVTITINVKKPYASYLMYNDTTLNNGLPFYQFSTNDYAAKSDVQYAKKALDMVSIVPNPYYAYSIYEDAGNALDARIKITNLPKRCQLDIYTLDGVLVRRMSKDDDTRTYVEWDLKNDAKVPIVSGIYLIHVKALDLGEERILKWIGVMRPADYDSY